MAVLSIIARNLFGRGYFVTGSRCCLSRYLSASSDDAKPRRPPSVFLLYYQNVRADLTKKHPDKSIGELSKMVTEQYKNLPEAEFQALKIESSKLMEEYKKKKEEWESSLSAEEKAKLTTDNREHRMKKQKRKLKKLQTENHKPKHPGSSFTMFVSDQLERKNLQTMMPLQRLDAVRKNMAECSALWKNLPEEERELYNQRFKEEKELYDVELKDWEDKMIQEDKISLVRKSTQHKVNVKKKKEGGNVVTVKKTKPKKAASKKAGVKSAIAKSSMGKSKKSVKSTKSSETKNKENEVEKSSDAVSSDTD